MAEFLNYILTALVAIVTALLGYFQGKKKTDAEADRAAYEAYSFALDSLRHEFEARITSLQQEIKELKESRCLRKDCLQRLQ